MNQVLRSHANEIIREAIAAVLPDAAVLRALAGKKYPGRVILVAVGKAAWRMAKTASDFLGGRIETGIVITKYGHAIGPIANYLCFEAGHPVPDENSLRATQAVLKLVSDLKPEDTVLFLLSGGGSALFEKPMIPLGELRNITDQLLASGADIKEINTIRKRLSAVKAGRFAQICLPARVEAVVLSDILGDPLDMIASGPAYPDSSTAQDARNIVRKYALNLSSEALRLLDVETPKTVSNVNTRISGSVRELCAAAEKACRRLGYSTMILTDQLSCEAREAGNYLSSVLRTHRHDSGSFAYIAGGETVVRVTGNGKGGRNQEIALSAAPGISGMKNAAVFSVGSDGTDGPTDAAGGYVDGDTFETLKTQGVSVCDILRNNDSYNALLKAGGLIFTGPTGTNVNDLSVALLRAD